MKLIIEYIEDIGWIDLSNKANDLNIPNVLTNDQNIKIDQKSIVISSFEFFNVVKDNPNVINTCTISNYDCLNYYPYVKDYLFNKDYIVKPVSYIRSNIESLIKTIGEEKSKRIFIRPNSGAKSFSGMVFLNIDPYFDYDWSTVEKKCKPDDLCIISSPKTIKEEYRFIVMDKEVITGSLYKRDYNVEYKEIESGYVFDFAQELANLYQPDKLFSLDVALGDDNNLYLMEINSFQHAGMYECNKEKILKKLLTFKF